jgi:oxalate decarboxylase/phosphoglucose isomerase-like protein (cupin superfamily)
VVVIPAQTAQRIVNTGQGDLVFLALCTPCFDESAYRDLEGEGRNR